jgi:hypothetical protein
MVDGYVYTYRGPAGGSEPLMAVCITSITIVELVNADVEVTMATVAMA